MAKIAIVCDNYKVEKFKEGLHAIGLTWTTQPFSTTTTLFTIISEQSIVQPVVQRVTQFFINKHSKGN